MPSSFTPLLNKMYVFQKHTILLLLSGQGMFQVDFRNYDFQPNNAIFLSPGQYFQLLSGNYVIKLYEFNEDTVDHTENSRFLFQHLTSIGHIQFNKPKQFYLDPLKYIEINEQSISVLIDTIENWRALNPFNASEQDVNLLFDLKEIIDSKFREPIDILQVSKELRQKPYRLNVLAKAKLNHTIHQLATDKILLEAKRKITFTDLSTKEIAYETGFKDPAYFNRFFKQQTHLTPYEFRGKYEFDERDTFIKDLTSLIDFHYKEQHSVEFYAEQLALSVKSLSQKLSRRLDTSVKQLIKEKIIAKAKQMLQQQISVHEVAYELGFQEPNHFSAFFKAATDKTPSQFLIDLQKSSQ
jgi:AraC-like DNA-binding protein